MKLNNTWLTHNEWCKKIEEELGIKMLPIFLVRFIKRTTLGLPWEENSQGGRPPYLFATDIEELKNESEIWCIEGTNYIELKNESEIWCLEGTNYIELEIKSPVYSLLPSFFNILVQIKLHHLSTQKKN